MEIAVRALPPNVPVATAIPVDLKRLWLGKISNMDVVHIYNAIVISLNY